MTLLPDSPVHVKERYQPRLQESAWVILDMMRGARAGKARYTVELQARWTADMLNEEFRDGLKIGRGSDRQATQY
jgi:hypothetical protein